MLSIVDHLVYATPDLDAGIAAIERLLGLPVVPGGRHEDWETRNALVSLGEATYLEIIGPDHEATIDGPPTLFGIDELDEPRLVTWAAKGHALVELAGSAKSLGVDLGPVSEGGRTLPDGTKLVWQLTDPYADRLGGVVPFLIDWGESLHPAAALPHACELVGLVIGHPDARGAEAALEAIGVPMSVATAERASISATIRTPTGTIELS